MHVLDVQRVGPSESRSVHIQFGEDLGANIESAASLVADWTTTHWSHTKFVLDHGTDEWTEPASPARLRQLFRGCAEHGWPFLLFDRSRRADPQPPTAESYSQLYLGVWPSRHAFALEVATAVDGPWGGGGDGVALDDSDVAEISAGFCCIDVDDRVWVFDLVDSSDGRSG